MRHNIRTATLADVQFVGKHLKEDDRQELTAVGPDLTPEHLQMAFNLSHKVLAWGPEGRPLAVFGVTADWGEKVGYVWSLSTPEILNQWRAVHRCVPEILDALGQEFSVLANMKDARQVRHIRWLRALGFVFIATHRIGPEGLPFHEFVRIQK
jgi:hypothetical protein